MNVICRKTIQVICSMTLCGCASVALSAPKCNPDKRWDEDTNKQSDDTAEQTNLTKVVKEKSEPEDRVDLIGKMLSPSGTASTAMEEVRDAAQDAESTEGAALRVGDMISKLKTPSGIAPEDSDIGKIRLSVKGEVGRLSSFDASEIGSAEKLSINDPVSLTNGALSAEEAEKLGVKGEVVDDPENIALLVAQDVYDVDSVEAEMVNSRLDSPLSGVEKAQLGLDGIPIVSQIFGLGVDIAAGVAAGAGAIGITGLIIKDILQDAIGFFSITPANVTLTEQDFSAVILAAGQADKAAGKVVKGLSDDVNPKILEALHGVLAKAYSDPVCPMGVTSLPGLCLVDRIYPKDGKVWSPFIEGDYLYVTPHFGKCPDLFRFTGTSCLSDPPIVMVGRDVHQDSNGVVSVTRWAPPCEKGTEYDGKQCIVQGLPAGAMKGRTLVVSSSNTLAITRTKDEKCPGDFRPFSHVDGRSVQYLCKPPVDIHLGERKAFVSGDMLFTSTAIEPTAEVQEKYFAHADNYQAYGDPSAFYNQLASDDKDGKAFGKQLDGIVEKLQLVYPVIQSSAQTQFKSALDLTSFHHLVGFQSSINSRLEILKYQLLIRSYIFRSQIRRALNLSYTGVSGCSNSLTDSLAYRNNSDSLSWLNYCQRMNSAKDTLLFNGSNEGKREEAVYKAYHDYQAGVEELLNKTVSGLTKMRDTSKGNYLKEAKKMNDSSNVHYRANAMADQNLIDVGRSVNNSLLNGTVLCLTNINGGANNCDAKVKTTYEYEGTDVTIEGKHSFYAKCWGNKEKSIDFFNDIGKQISKDSKSDISVWFEGDCGKEDTISFAFNEEKNTVFNPKNMTDERSKNLKEVVDYFRNKESKQNPYFIDLQAYVNNLTGDANTAGLYPNEAQSFSNSQSVKKLFTLSQDGQKALQDAETKMFLSKPDFIYSINNFLKKHFNVKSYKDVVGVDFGVKGGAKGGGDYDLFELLFLNYGQEYCRYEQEEKKVDKDCLSIVLPYARPILDQVYGVPFLALQPGADKSKDLIFKSFKDRPQKAKPDCNPHDCQGFIGCIAKAAECESKWTDYDKRAVFNLALPDQILVKGKKLNFTEGHYASLRKSPGDLYYARLMEQGYQDFGGWMTNMDKVVKDNFKNDPVTQADIHDYLASFHDLDEHDLYKRSDTITKTVAQAMKDKKSDTYAKTVKMHDLAAELLNSATSNVVGRQAVNELFSNKNFKPETFDLLKSGWSAKDSKHDLAPLHDPKSNSLIVLGGFDPSHDGGSVVFSRKSSPVWKATSKEEKDVTFNDAVRGSFSISCVDKASHTVLDKSNDAVLTLSIGEGGADKKFEVALRPDKGVMSVRLPKDGNKLKDIKLDVDRVFCPAEATLPATQDEFSSPAENTMVNVEFYLGKNPGTQFYDPDNLPDTIKKDAPYIYKMMVNGHLFSGVVDEGVFQGININQVSFVANYRNAHGIALYNPFSFYYKYPEQKESQSQ